MRIRNYVSSLVLAAACVTGLASGGCEPQDDAIVNYYIRQNELMKEKYEHEAAMDRLKTPFEREQEAKMRHLIPSPVFPIDNDPLRDMGRDLDPSRR